MISKITVKCQLVSRYFEPSQPQRIVSGLNTNFKFSLSPSDNAHKSSHHKFSKNHKISPNTNLHKIYTNIKHKMFKELVPLVLPLLKKHIKLGHAGIVDHSIKFINTRFFLKYKKEKKEWTEAIKNLNII